MFSTALSGVVSMNISIFVKRIALHAGVTDSKSAIRMMSMLEKVCIKKENVGKKKTSEWKSETEFSTVI